MPHGGGSKQAKHLWVRGMKNMDIFAHKSHLNLEDYRFSLPEYYPPFIVPLIFLFLRLWRVRETLIKR
jgi:hypothetical protein